MIDEERLTELLRDLGATVEVPPEGPPRVLARRDAMRRIGPDRGAVPGGARPRPRPVAGQARRLAPWIGRHGAALAASATAVAALALTFVIVGSPAGSRKSAGVATAGQAARGPAGSRDLQVAGGGESAASSASAASTAGPPTTAAASAGPIAAGVGGAAASGGVASVGPATSVPGVSPQVVKTGSVDLVVKTGQLGGTIDQLDSLAAGLGGFVTSSQTSEGGTSPTGDLTLRVPAAQFELLLTRVRALGRPVSVTTSGQDVTAQYVDLQARIDALTATRQQFLQILAKAQQIADILSVEEQINDLQVQIEQLQGQLRVLDDQATYSTLSVHVSQQAATPVALPSPHASGLSAAWAHARHSFSTGLEAVVSWTGGFGVFLVCLAGLALVARLGWSVVRRRLVGD